MDSKLATKWIPAKWYDRGRDGRRVVKITIHHMAGILTSEQCGRSFQGSRQVSAHYGIGVDGDIAQYVDESNTAWSDGQWDSNCKSISIEVSNDKTGGEWHVSDASLNSLIRLVADICTRYNLTPVKGKTITWHSMYANTTCCGDYLRSKMDYIVVESKKTIAGGSNKPSNPSEPDAGYNYDPNARLTVKQAIKAGQSEGNKFCNENVIVDGIVGYETNLLKGKILQHAMNKDYLLDLVEDGIIGVASLRALGYHTVRQGEIQHMVTALQILLLLNGYNPHGVDGIFGNGTLKATKQFQADTGLTVDGIAGRNTFLELVR